MLYVDLVYGDPNQALFFGGMGIVAALVFGNMGAAYGTAKSGVGICSVAVLKPELIIKSIIPVVMAGILGIYGLIISVIISGSCKSPYSARPFARAAVCSHFLFIFCCSEGCPLR